MINISALLLFVIVWFGFEQWSMGAQLVLSWKRLSWKSSGTDTGSQRNTVWNYVFKINYSLANTAQGKISNECECVQFLFDETARKIDTICACVAFCPHPKQGCMGKLLHGTQPEALLHSTRPKQCMCKLLHRSRVRKSPLACWHCQPESFCASGKFLRVFTKWAQNQVKM